MIMTVAEKSWIKSDVKADKCIKPQKHMQINFKISCLHYTTGNLKQLGPYPRLSSHTNHLSLRIEMVEYFL